MQLSVIVSILVCLCACALVSPRSHSHKHNCKKKHHKHNKPNTKDLVTKPPPELVPPLTDVQGRANLNYEGRFVTCPEHQKFMCPNCPNSVKCLLVTCADKAKWSLQECQQTFNCTLELVCECDNANGYFRTSNTDMNCSLCA